MQLCARGTNVTQLRLHIRRNPVLDLATEPLKPRIRSGNRSNTQLTRAIPKSAYRKSDNSNYSWEWTRNDRTSLGCNRKQFDFRSFDHSGVFHHQGPSLASDPLHGYSLARLCYAAKQGFRRGIGTSKYLESGSKVGPCTWQPILEKSASFSRVALRTLLPFFS